MLVTERKSFERTVLFQSIDKNGDAIIINIISSKSKKIDSGCGVFQQGS